MKQFEVPQYIDIEGKILGPLTVRQTLIMAIAAGAVFLLRLVLEDYLLIPAAIGIGVVALALAFVKVNTVPLADFIMLFLQYMMFPRLYVWKKKGTKYKKEIYSKKKAKEGEYMTEPSPEETAERLRAYAQRQDTPTSGDNTQ